MSEKILSVFIDESGDFGQYDYHTPYYLVAMILHNQDVNITDNINVLDKHVKNLGFSEHAIHTGPLIRREAMYSNLYIEERKKLFNALFNFARKLDFHYICPIIKKSECPDVITLTSKLSKAIAKEIKAKEEFWNNFDKINIYYDNGQVELTKILTSVFSTLYSNVDFRKVKPIDYKLFQVADLICTLELVSVKNSDSEMSKSELEFFKSARDFKKNYYKHLSRKHL